MIMSVVRSPYFNIFGNDLAEGYLALYPFESLLLK